MIDEVWEKGTVIDDNIKDFIRNDKFGNHICKSYYGMETEFGWEIAYIKPLSEGGTDDIDNLQPLYWKNNRKKKNKQKTIIFE